jgi:hypothetical protein
MNKVRLQRKTSSLRVGDHQDRIPVKLNQDRHRVLTDRKSKSLKWIFPIGPKVRFILTNRYLENQPLSSNHQVEII